MTETGAADAPPPHPRTTRDDSPPALAATAIAADLGARVDSLMATPPLSTSPETPLREAAAAMTRAGVSSIIVEGDEPGIVTDRDVRERGVATGLHPDVPVGRIMSKPLVTVAAAAPASAALLLMLREKIHHLPVVDGESLVGVVTDTDLLRHEAKSPVYLRKWVEEVGEHDDLERYAVDLTSTCALLLRGGLDPLHIAGFVGELNDALVRRLLFLAEKQMGRAPCEYAWLSLGSQGRREQLLPTDQDNALVLAASSAGASDYFAELAAFVTHGLERAGFERCPANCMATTLRFPLPRWEEMFVSWIEHPKPEAIVDAGMMFDARVVAGDLDASSLQDLVLGAREHGIFLRYVAQEAVRHPPPLSFFRRIRTSNGSLDLKHAAVAPIVALGRVCALETGNTSKSTADRLLSAAPGLGMSEESAERLAEDLAFLLGLRLSARLEATDVGGGDRNLVRVDRLSQAKRKRLRDALANIKTTQRSVADRYGLAVTG